LKRLAAQRLPLDDWENLLQLAKLERLMVRVPSGKTPLEFLVFMEAHPNASSLHIGMD
jgi:hypothetical protein